MITEIERPLSNHENDQDGKDFESIPQGLLGSVETGNDGEESESVSYFRQALKRFRTTLTDLSSRSQDKNR